MELELSAEAKDKRLNRLVAITVVVLSVFMGLCNIKDGNIVQNMAQAKADSVDRWGEYQATRTKVHIVETARATASLLPATERTAIVLQQFDADIAKYNAETPKLASDAKALADRYDALNVHDDQFDASEALISTAISLAAVSALSESFLLLLTCWAFGASGVFMGVCGFAGLAFHPDVLSNFLG
jgi:hypothetical protein